jgi:hypothetical protein
MQRLNDFIRVGGDHGERGQFYSRLPIFPLLP